MQTAQKNSVFGSQGVGNLAPERAVCIRNISDYSPFGVSLDGRTIEGDRYRYGYQGSERDDEAKGSGNSYTTFYRQLDPRVGRWYGIDPKSTAWESPFVSMGNHPLLMNDKFGDSTDFYDKEGNLLKHIEDGSNAKFKLKGEGNTLHYSFDGFDEKQNGENHINSTVAIQEQQNLNMENPSLQQNADGYNETHCNQSAQCIMRTVSSYTNSNVLIMGNANSMFKQFQEGTNTNYTEVSKSEAIEFAEAGGLAFVLYNNPNGHGHIASFSVGNNINKGEVANIGPKKYTGFVKLNNAIGKRKDKKYYIMPESLNDKQIQEVTVKPNY